jgi:hypothetical protein
MKILRFAIGLFVTATTLSSCIKHTFDAPVDVSLYDPKVPVNLTISQLSDIAFNLGTGGYRVLGDSTIYGIVTADDRTGNFYKQIVIQDSTGGIVIAIGQVDLYNDYPIGRKVYIKLRGLTIIDYKGLPEVVNSVTVTSGTLTVVGIPSIILATNVIKASYPNNVEPLKVRLIDLAGGSNYYLNRLVEIENMEFDPAYVNIPYAPNVATGTIASTLILSDCPRTGSINLYNSAYATFQPVLTPSGKGTLTGIYSFYGSSSQFLIRDTSDIHLTGNRDCP